MSIHAAPHSFPRFPLIAVGGLVGFSLLMAVAGSINGPTVSVTPSAQVQSRDLRFEDRGDGSVAVIDADSGVTVDVAAPGTNGFLRATLRGLVRERKHETIGPAVPFRLTRWADGRLTLEDPTTGRKVEMEAFGETNEAVFARLLTAQRGAP
jgi:putative photosynthetic complex assembly protein